MYRTILIAIVIFALNSSYAYAAAKYKCQDLLDEILALQKFGSMDQPSASVAVKKKLGAEYELVKLAYDEGMKKVSLINEMKQDPYVDEFVQTGSYKKEALAFARSIITDKNSYLISKSGSPISDDQLISLVKNSKESLPMQSLTSWPSMAPEGRVDALFSYSKVIPAENRYNKEEVEQREITAFVQNDQISRITIRALSSTPHSASTTLDVISTPTGCKIKSFDSRGHDWDLPDGWFSVSSELCNKVNSLTLSKPATRDELVKVIKALNVHGIGIEFDMVKSLDQNFKVHSPLILDDLNNHRKMCKVFKNYLMFGKAPMDGGPKLPEHEKFNIDTIQAK